MPDIKVTDLERTKPSSRVEKALDGYQNIFSRLEQFTKELGILNVWSKQLREQIIEGKVIVKVHEQERFADLEFRVTDIIAKTVVTIESHSKALDEMREAIMFNEKY